ncbi:MATE family efflux transporter [Hydrogenophaga crocea]|uniref:Multidrug-efflux transporter n=1 Tax=Hydrogenophaga crocea TaxID=2716225 RepID=A0A6G8IHL2_9BURK|nr:MATE family efflux transporter [Hydrogenophaga crocea]QIM52599.1 MATE family efflux transporter [Hydrogenophaga crocea]
MTRTDTTAPPPSLWADLRAALRGTQADYTRIPLKRAVLLLAIPMMLELVLESTFAVVDIFFVAQLGASAVATVGLTETYLFLLYSVAMGLATAVTAIVARRVGEQRGEAAALSAVQAIVLAVLVSLPVTFAGIFWAQDLLRLMGADAWAIEHGYRYTQWMLGGNLVILLLFVINAVFRGAGDAAAAMRVLWVANAVNIALDPLLIFGLGPIPAMGVEGAAIATNIGRGVGVLMQLWILARGSEHLRLTAASLRWDGATLLQIARTSLGGIGQMIIAMTAWVFLMRILASLSTEAVAGATIAMRVMMFTLMPAWGMSNAAATLVGQNLGAGDAVRAEAAVWRIGWMNMVFTLAVSVAFFFAHDAIIGLFTDDPAVIAVGGEWLSILAYSYFVYGWWMVAVQAFNGAGDTLTPTWINFVFFWLIQLPLAWALALPLGWAHSGVFWGVFVSETAVGLFTLWLFSRGGWKKVRV